MFTARSQRIGHEGGPLDPMTGKILRSSYLDNGCHGSEKRLNGFKYFIYGNNGHMEAPLWMGEGTYFHGNQQVAMATQIKCEFYHQKHMARRSRKGSNSTLANWIQWQPSNRHDNQKGYSI